MNILYTVTLSWKVLIKRLSAVLIKENLLSTLAQAQQVERYKKKGEGLLKINPPERDSPLLLSSPLNPRKKVFSVLSVSVSLVCQLC